MLKVFAQEKLLKYLIIGLSVAAVGILVREIFLKKEPPPALVLPPLDQEIVIDFDLLENQRIKALTPFSVLSYPPEVGREDPFADYD